MPTTSTNFAWTIPSDTDLVKDGADAIRTLGNAVDASLAAVTLRAVTTTSDTFVLADLRNKLVTYANASAIAVTIPLNSSVAFPIGTSINIAQTGAGQVTVSGAVGVTVRSTGATATTPKTRVIYSAITCIKIATDEWLCVGDIA
jgi:hypothetical protein